MQLAIVMKVLPGKYRFLYAYVIPLLVVVLVLCAGFLYQQNQEVRRLNRDLMVQNDSVLSVNLELRRALQREAALRSKPGVSLKVQ